MKAGTHSSNHKDEINIDSLGYVYGVCDEVGRVDFGRISVVTFNNPGKLTYVGDNLFQSGEGSKNPIYWSLDENDSDVRHLNLKLKLEYK